MEMMKKNRGKLLLSSLLILLPVLAGLFLWNDLPNLMEQRWGIIPGSGWDRRFALVFAEPLLMLLFHWICLIIVMADRKNKDQDKKVLGMVFWLCPMISLFLAAVLYAGLFGTEVWWYLLLTFPFGLIFILFGNYLPKCRQNRTVGIKTVWALENEENWNATHRFGGKVWFAMGFVIMICGLGSVFSAYFMFPFAAALIAAGVVPLIYSYLYYRRQVKEGKINKNKISGSRSTRLTTGITAIFLLIVFAYTGVMMFTGDFEIFYGTDSFTIAADHWDDLTVAYEDIEKIAYQPDDFSSEVRINGFGNFRLSMGAFHNDAFGDYTRYSYGGCDSCVVLTVKERVLVLSGKDETETKEIYEKLMEVL